MRIFRLRRRIIFQESNAKRRAAFTSGGIERSINRTVESQGWSGQFRPDVAETHHYLPVEKAVRSLTTSKAHHQLHELDLPPGAGLAEKIVKMRLHRRLGNPEEVCPPCIFATALRTLTSLGRRPYCFAIASSGGAFGGVLRMKTAATAANSCPAC